MTQQDSFDERERRAYLSVAVSFGDLDALQRWGAQATTLTCPECGASGRLLGTPGDEMRLEGFSAQTKGGTHFVLATCDKCDESVSLTLRAS